MRTFLLTSSILCAMLPVAAFAQTPAAEAPAGQTAPPQGVASPIEQIDIIAPTPLLGSGVDRDKIPGNTIVSRADDLIRTGTANATRALDENDSSIDLDQAVGNEFQPNLLFRGVEASPLAGDAQGLAVYVDGSRWPAAPYGQGGLNSHCPTVSWTSCAFWRRGKA
jgi:hypothetical protein